MRAVSESCRYMHREADNGLKICADGGWVHFPERNKAGHQDYGARA